MLLEFDGPAPDPTRRRPPPESGAATRPLKKAIAVRDLHICHWCGFRSKKYQEVVALTGRLRDVDDLATACVFCEQCFFLPRVRSMKSGVFIWLPELDQPTVNCLAREIYVARIKPGPRNEAARALLDRLLTRRAAARETLGFEVSDIGETSNQWEPQREALARAAGIRLMPTDRRVIREADLEFNQFPQILAYWRSRDGPYANDSTPWLREHAGLLE